MSKIKGFYSAVDKAAQALARSKGTGKEFMVEVAKTKGVKPTEIQTRGLQRIADLPKMSKEEFIKELEKSPAPNLRETHIGEYTEKDIREVAQELMYEDATEEAKSIRSRRGDREDVIESIFEEKMDNEMDEYMERAREHIADTEIGPKYSEYRTEGGENYREILMRLPSESAKNQKRIMDLEAKERRSSHNFDFGNGITPEELEELKRLRSIQAFNPPDYKSPHWKEPNVLAHMRVQDRFVPTYTKDQIDDIGNRISQLLNVDEKELGGGAPSFAVQKGVITPLEAAQYSHAKGFHNVDKTGATQKVLHVEEVQSDWHQAGRKHGYQSPPKPKSTEQSFGLQFDPIYDKEVPDAPFKKNWHELAMKRLLNYAAENGYDKIAITPGAEQAKRYDLTKYINELQYDPEKKTLEAWGHGGVKVFDERNVSEDMVADYIGKEIAEKLLAQKPEDTPVKQLFNVDMHVGGEGMKGFYDKMLPDYLNTYGKRYGTQVQINHPQQYETGLLNPYENEAGVLVEEPEVKTMHLHSFDITPQMRQDIMSEGLPMFAGGGAVFDPEGSDYDYATAKSAGLGPTGEGENKGHWGSVTMASEEDKKLHNLPEDSYLVLKGRKHETWNKAEDAERARGSEIVKRGSRYYSVPKGYADGGAVKAAVGGEYNTDPDMQDGGKLIQGTVFKKGGRVKVSNNPDAMLMEVSDRKFGAGGALRKGIKAIKEAQEILPLAEREENLNKFLSPSKIKEKVYHATPHEFSEFKLGGEDPTLSGRAVWMSTDPKRQPAAHNTMTRASNYKQGVRVMPLHVQAKNPLVLDDPTMIEWAREVFAGGSREFPELLPPHWIDEVRKEGYDSIYFADPYGRNNTHEVIMFEPNKIKSAIGNRGTYDITDPDITKQNGGLAQIQRK